MGSRDDRKSEVLAESNHNQLRPTIEPTDPSKSLPVAAPSDERDGSETPDWLFDHIQRRVKEITGHDFELDAAASDWNAKCARYFDEGADALEQDWSAFRTIWCNPPFNGGPDRAIRRQGDRGRRTGFDRRAAAALLARVSMVSGGQAERADEGCDRPRHLPTPRRRPSRPQQGAKLRQPRGGPPGAGYHSRHERPADKPSGGTGDDPGTSATGRRPSLSGPSGRPSPSGAKGGIDHALRPDPGGNGVVLAPPHPEGRTDRPRRRPLRQQEQPPDGPRRSGLHGPGDARRGGGDARGRAPPARRGQPPEDRAPTT